LHAVMGLALADRAAHERFLSRAARIKAEAGVQDDAPVTEQDLSELPEPMARFMRFSGVLGKRRIGSLRLRYSGRFKPSTNKPWMPVRGEYFRPSLMWYGKVRRVPGINVMGVRFVCRRQWTDADESAVHTVVDDRFRQVSQSAFGRCVAELTMAPTFFLDRSRVRCAQTGNDQVCCTVTDGQYSTEADFFINPDGSPHRVVVLRYFDRGGSEATLERFTGKALIQRASAAEC
jgi:hypothetical protein